MLCHGNPSKHIHTPTLSCLLKLIASVLVCNRPGKLSFLLTYCSVQVISCLPWIKSTTGMCLGSSICTLQGCLTAPPHPFPWSQHCRMSWFPGCLGCLWETLIPDGSLLWPTRETIPNEHALEGAWVWATGRRKPSNSSETSAGRKDIAKRGSKRFLSNRGKGFTIWHRGKANCKSCRPGSSSS